VRYWDASAVVPLLVSEPGTEQVRAILAEDARIVTWVWTTVEITSAIERRARSGELSREERRAALSALQELADTWDEVTDATAVRRFAVRLLARHSIPAADAAQLAAALLVSSELGTNITFVCLDARLSDAAEREGLEVQPLPEGL
jgi:uncharacterized protein